MKKILLSLTAICLTLAFLPACNQNSGEAHTLKMRLAKGDKFSQDLDMDMDVSMDMMGQNMKMEMGMKAANDFEVLADSANYKNILITYRKAAMTMEMAGMPGAENIDQNEVMKRAADRIVGKQVTMQLNDKNDIVSVSGFDEMMLADSTMSPEERQQLKQFFSQEQLNSMFSMMFQVYPDKPVKLGDTWTKEIKTGMSNIAMTIDMKYKLTAVKDGIAYIDADGKVKTKGIMNSGGMDVEMDMKGTQKGKMNIGLDDGYLRDGQFTMDIDAEMVIQNMKIPVKMKGSYLMKGQN